MVSMVVVLGWRLDLLSEFFSKYNISDFLTHSQLFPLLVWVAAAQSLHSKELGWSGLVCAQVNGARGEQINSGVVRRIFIWSEHGWLVEQSRNTESFRDALVIFTPDFHPAVPDNPTQLSKPLENAATGCVSGFKMVIKPSVKTKQINFQMNRIR